MTERSVHDRSSIARHPFVLRIWREEGGLGWKGWVQHAGTGESLTVQSLDDLLAFIERWTGTLTDIARKGQGNPQGRRGEIAWRR